MTVLQRVDVGVRSVAAYRGTAPDQLLDELIARAEPLRGARVLHISATAYGGGVSELLRSAVPLMRDLGLEADWRVIGGEGPFFAATKRIHNGLQGAAEGLRNSDREVYLETNSYNAKALEEGYDVIVVHDPQPAALLSAGGPARSRWVWRCHIDTSEPNAEVWSFVRGFLADYDAAVFTMEGFRPPDIPLERVRVIPPAIDPLSPKNLDIPRDTARGVLDWLGVRLDRPLVTQVARFDPWKDPLGVIAAYRLVREKIPDLELVLAGSMALDDPEGWEIYRSIAAEDEGDPQIHAFSNLTGVGNIEVNALQRLSDVVVQKSIREGFGLVVSEALWKATPVVAGRAGGIPLQMPSSVGGLLVDDVESCAAGILELLQNPGEASELARRGREHVRERFLLPRLLLDELLLLGETIGPAARQTD
jgi:trehalose synthase